MEGVAPGAQRSRGSSVHGTGLARRPQHAQNGSSPLSTRVGATQFYVARLEELRRQIRDEQQASKASTVPSAFVTYKCAPCLLARPLRARACAARSRPAAPPGPAPHPWGLAGQRAQPGRPRAVTPGGVQHVDPGAAAESARAGRRGQARRAVRRALTRGRGGRRQDVPGAGDGRQHDAALRHDRLARDRRAALQ